MRRKRRARLTQRQTGSKGGGEGEGERRGAGGRETGDFSGSPHPETAGGGGGGGSGERMTGAAANQAPTGALVNSAPNGDTAGATIGSSVSSPNTNNHRRSVTEPGKGGVAGGGKNRSQPGQGASGSGSQPRFTSVAPSAFAQHPHHVDGAGGVRGGEMSTEAGTGRRNSTYTVYPVSVGRRPKKDGGDVVVEGAVGPYCVRQDRRRRRANAGGSRSSSGSQGRRQGGGGGKGGIGSRVRRILRIRTKGSGLATEYANVFLVLGLYDGGDLIQNGYVCLRAADISDGGVEGGGVGGTGASCNYSVQPDIVIIGVKVAITAPTLLEERRAVIYLRDYLANQLSVYPFLRHCILVTKKSKKRRKKTVFYTVLGSGQYTAIVNTSTQVDGITPLEVCLLRRTGGPRFDPQSTRHRGSVLGSVVSTLRSSVRDLGFASE